MIKIISQDRKSIFDIERNNLFVCGNKILISDKVNIYEGKAACLGTYNNEQEAEDVLMKIIETFTTTPNVDNTFYCGKMPEKKEIKEDIQTNENNQEGVLDDGREQGETRENSQI